MSSFNGMRVVGTITLVEHDMENGCAAAVFAHGVPILHLILPEVAAALDPFIALTNFGSVLKMVGKMAAKDKADAAFIAEVAEVSAQMEALEAKWNACTEDHKGRSTDRPCPACGFGG